MRSAVRFASSLLVICSVAVLRADTTPAPTVPGSTDASADATAKAKLLSPAEMNVRASAMLAESQEDLRQVMFLKEHARKLKDVIKLNCVNDKLVKLKAQLNIQDSTNADLQVALTRDGDARVTAFAHLEDVSTDIKQLTEDAKACVGEPELYKQESGVIVTHPDLPDNPVLSPPDFTGTDIEPPGYASPFN